MRSQNTLYCNICDGMVILPSPAFMSSHKPFVAAHIDSIQHLENLNKIPYQAPEGGVSVAKYWQNGSE